MILSLSSDDKNFEKVLEKINIGFFAFFVFELISKLIGQGIKHYLRDKFNWFDGMVVLVSAIDITLLYTLYKDNDDYSSGGITVLRVFRLIRIF
jgi:hypothetical protein